MSLKMKMQSSTALNGTTFVLPSRPRSHTRRPIGCSARKTPVVRAIVQEQTPQQAGTKEAENQLEALKAISLVVADTGEIDSIRKYYFRLSSAAKQHRNPNSAVSMITAGTNLWTVPPTPVWS